MEDQINIIGFFVFCVLVVLWLSVEYFIRRNKLKKLQADNFPDVESAIFLIWKNAEYKRINLIFRFILGLGILSILIFIFARLNVGDSDTETFLSVVFVIIMFGLLILMFCVFSETDEQKKIRINKQVKSFYEPTQQSSSPSILDKKEIALEAFGVDVRIAHILKSESTQEFMSNVRRITTTYRDTAYSSLFSPNKLIVINGQPKDMKRTAYLTCSECGAKIAVNVTCKIYDRIPHSKLCGNPELKYRIARYIFLKDSWHYNSGLLICGLVFPVFINICHIHIPFWLGLILDISLFFLIIALYILILNNKLQKRDTLLEFPRINTPVIKYLENWGTNPVNSIYSVDIESEFNDMKHGIVLLNDNDDRSVHSRTIYVHSSHYNEFGLESPFIPI